MSVRIAPLCLAGVLSIAGGCATTSPPIVDVGTVETVTERIEVDDPGKMFAEVFREGLTFARGELETSREYDARLAVMDEGIAGRVVTYLVEPKECMVFAYPDQSFYVVATSEFFFERIPYLPKESASLPEEDFTLPVRTNISDATEHEMVDENGLRKTLTAFTSTQLRVKCVNLPHVPDFKWRKETTSKDIHFGIPIKFTAAEADREFRAALAAGRVGIAIRGRIAPLVNAKAQNDLLTTEGATPALITRHRNVLPVEITDAWLVRVDDMTT